VKRQIGVGDSKNVIVFDPVHMIRRMRCGRVRIFNGNQWEPLYLVTHELDGRVGHVTRHVRQLFKVKRS